MPLTIDAYYEAERYFIDVRQEWEKTHSEYWQGKKDGVRAVMALVAPNEQEKRTWELLNDSSGGGQATEREILLDQIKDAHRILDLLVADQKWNARHDALEWLDWVKHTKTVPSK